MQGRSKLSSISIIEAYLAERASEQIFFPTNRSSRKHSFPSYEKKRSFQNLKHFYFLIPSNPIFVHCVSALLYFKLTACAKTKTEKLITHYLVFNISIFIASELKARTKLTTMATKRILSFFFLMRQ